MPMPARTTGQFFPAFPGFDALHILMKRSFPRIRRLEHPKTGMEAHPPVQRPFYAGFTLIELLVSIAIIGVLVALLLPAIQHAREAARRMQCANNLKQVATAIQIFESTHNVLPAAGTFAPPEEARSFKWGYLQSIDVKSGTNYSWMVKLLPYLEEDVLYRQFNFSVPVTRNPSDPQAHQIASLLCPSDAALGRFFETTEPDTGRTVRFGKANYAAFVNPMHVDGWLYAGAISLYGQRLSQITDGTSQTLAISEVRTRDNAEDVRGAWALPWSGSSLLSFDMHPSKPESDDCAPYKCLDYDALKSTSRTSPPKFSPWLGCLGYTQSPNGREPDILYRCPEPEVAQLERLQCAEFDNVWYMSAAPRSNHDGGVNVAFLDGRVTFLTDDVDEFAMSIMVSVDDGMSPDQQH